MSSFTTGLVARYFVYEFEFDPTVEHYSRDLKHPMKN